MVWINAIIQGILLGGQFALFATGLSLAFGVMRFVNLAHGDIAMVAAYATLSLGLTLHLNPLVCLLLILPGAFGVGYLLQRIVFGRVVGVDPAFQIVATAGMSVVLQNLIFEKYTADNKGLNPGKTLKISGLRINDKISLGYLPLLTLGFAIVVLSALALFMKRTRTGRAFRATSDDSDAARLMGIDVRKIWAVAMGLAVVTVALAGVLYASSTTIDPFGGPARLIYGFEAVIIGGLGSLWGTLVGGVVLGIAQALGRQINPQWGELAGHFVFLGVLVFRPTGLFGKGQVR